MYGTPRQSETAADSGWGRGGGRGQIISGGQGAKTVTTNVIKSARTCTVRPEIREYDTRVRYVVNECTYSARSSRKQSPSKGWSEEMLGCRDENKVQSLRIGLAGKDDEKDICQGAGGG